MLLVAQMENVLGSIPLVGCQIDPAILLDGLDPALSVEIHECLDTDVKAGGGYRDLLISRHF